MLGNLEGNSDLISLVTQIVRQEITSQENRRKEKENGGVTQISSVQISELDTKISTISTQYERLEKTLRFCESEISEVKTHIEEENDHHKTSIQNVLKNVSEEMDIKLQQLSLVNSPRNPVGHFSSEREILRTTTEGNVKEPEERKEEGKSRAPAPLSQKLPDIPKNAISNIFDTHKKPPKSQNPNDFAGGFFDNPYLEVGDKKMTVKPQTTSIFDEDDNEQLVQENSDLFSSGLIPKNSETNSEKKKQQSTSSIFEEEDDEDSFGLFAPKKESDCRSS